MCECIDSLWPSQHRGRRSRNKAAPAQRRSCVRGFVSRHVANMLDPIPRPQARTR
jgi:hypothetical protein